MDRLLLPGRFDFEGGSSLLGRHLGDDLGKDRVEVQGRDQRSFGRLFLHGFDALGYC